jgi:hypothetical protein
MRIEYDTEPPYAGQLDELVAENASVHIERMSSGVIWIRVNEYVITIWANDHNKVVMHCEADV